MDVTFENMAFDQVLLLNWTIQLATKSLGECQKKGMYDINAALVVDSNIEKETVSILSVV